MLAVAAVCQNKLLHECVLWIRSPKAPLTRSCLRMLLMLSPWVSPVHLARITSCSPRSTDAVDTYAYNLMIESPVLTADCAWHGPANGMPEQPAPFLLVCAT